MMCRASFLLAVSAVVVGGAWAGSGSVAARSLAARCSTDVQGPAFTVAGRSTRRYVVEVQRVSCVFARPWVAKLVKQSRFQRLRGPAGWTCLAETKTNSRLASGGVCGRGKFRLPTIPAIGFGWYPDLG